MHERFTGEQELVPGKLRGFRWFRTNENSRYGIGAVFKPVAWRVHMSAKCYSVNNGQATNKHCSSPNIECHCGIYAYYSPPFVETLRAADDLMYGVIEVTGRVLLGSSGFRAENASIVAIARPPTKASESRLEKAGVAVYGSRIELEEYWLPDDVSELVELEEPTVEEVARQQRIPSFKPNRRKSPWQR